MQMIGIALTFKRKPTTLQMAQSIYSDLLKVIEEVDPTQLWLTPEQMTPFDLYSFNAIVPTTNLLEPPIDLTNEPDFQTLLISPSERDDNKDGMSAPPHFHLEKFILKQLINEEMMKDEQIQRQWQSALTDRQLNRLNAQALQN